MKEVDITIPVVIDRTTQELRATVETLQNETGIADYIVECALERFLLELKTNRVNLYGTTLYHMNQKVNENAHIDVQGTEEELRRFAEENNIPIKNDGSD